MDKVELYSYYRSSCSWRVRLALHYKNIEFEYRAVHLVKNEQYAENYVVLNPMKEVPTLCISGHVLSQSRSIIEYLEEVYPEPSIMPKNALERAKVRQISDIITSDIQPVQNLKVMNKAVAEQAQRPEWAKYWITSGFDGLELALQQTAGKYCVGDEITMADFCLVPQVYNAKRFNVDMTKYPIISRIDAVLTDHPVFVKAHPKAQPDCPEAER